MGKQFDDFSKSLAEEGVSRKEALRKIGVSLAGVLLATMGLSGKALSRGGYCTTNADCKVGDGCCSGTCIPWGNDNCGYCGAVCPKGTHCIAVKVTENIGYYCSKSR